MGELNATATSEWDRSNAAMKAIMSVPPETAAAIRRGESKSPESRAAARQDRRTDKGGGRDRTET